MIQRGAVRFTPEFWDEIGNELPRLPSLWLLGETGVIKDFNKRIPAVSVPGVASERGGRIITDI